MGLLSYDKSAFGFHQNLSVPEDLSAYDGLELRVKGDGRRYKMIVRISPEWDTVGYTASFDTEKGWQTVSDFYTRSMWYYLEFFTKRPLHFLETSKKLLSFVFLLLPPLIDGQV